MAKSKRPGRGSGKTVKKQPAGRKPAGKSVLYYLSHPALLITLQLLIGSIFLIASVGKLFDTVKFMDKVYEYSILPDSLVPLFASVMPWIEFSIGVLLVLDIYVQSAGLLACGSLIAFMIAIGVQVSRGVSMDCGCFDFLIPDEKTGWAAIGRDSVMVALASLLVFFGRNEISVYGLWKRIFKK